ncbi:cytochrome P450 monooxygenase [Rhodofomes roseus]|uniref:Cytochrome P450 monooxygenase n=1 Tax=Rhodofomes roseus TaxID=34475 RepID=A0ABQ8KAU9_9APHY|nr:cytochrome P450 monooxygenase [Rhodofomes roseus]KAH9834637.1 cytochrome P450 monooxygenase [Rhodofomes roseus]
MSHISQAKRTLVQEHTGSVAIRSDCLTSIAYTLLTMSFPLGVQAALGLVVLVGIIHFGLQGRQFRRGQLPPGPRQLPILGNVAQMTLEFPEKRFAQWRETYGDIVYLKIFNTHVLVINSVTAARELLGKRSFKYSDRPHLVLLTEMLGWEHDFGLLPYNEEVRKHRRWMHLPFFSKTSLSAFAEVQRREAVTLLTGLLRDPKDFGTHIHRYSASTMLQCLYGHTVASSDDEYLHLIEKALDETMGSSAPGAAPVDFIPMLKYIPAWVPGARFKRTALWVKTVVQDAARRTYALAESKLSEDTGAHFVLPELIKASSAKGLLEHERPEIMMFGLTLYAAGTDTTQTVVMVFLLAMVLNPDVYAKAQEEMDRVVGTSRIPTIEDRPALPYLECILKETYRFSCPAPLGMPHKNCEDDEYRGYWIPKGTTVVANLWFMLHDPATYPDPDAFRPERFNGLNDDQEDPRNIVFGFGRRICPGRRFADIGIWHAMANIITTFDVRKTRDAMGDEITPPGTFSSGLVNHPHKFQCSITPRSKQATELILGGV